MHLCQKRIPVRRAFTLIELMVVVAIIVLLVALLVPTLARAKEEAKLVKCGANLHAVAIALATYESQNKDMLPSVGSNVPQTGNGSGVWLPDWYGSSTPGSGTTTL